MVLYAAVMFFAAILFAVLTVLIYRGKTELIHDYHRQRVTDKKGYGKAFGKAMSPLSLGMFLSGILALFGEAAMWAAVAVLVGGLLAGITGILRVQKKYNGGVFS